MHESLSARESVCMCVCVHAPSVYANICTVMCTDLCANWFQMFGIEFEIQSTVSGIEITAYRFLFIHLFLCFRAFAEMFVAIAREQHDSMQCNGHFLIFYLVFHCSLSITLSHRGISISLR